MKAAHFTNYPKNIFSVFIFLHIIFSAFAQERKVIEKAFPDGRPSLVIYYNEKNEKVREISYFSNGKTDYEGHFKNQKEHGKWTYYYEDGQKKFEENYKNGFEDGKQYEWEPDGQLTKVEIFKSGKLTETIEGKKYKGKY